MCILLIGLTSGSAKSKDFSIALYGGRMTEEKWFETLSFDTKFVDATIVVGAVSWTFRRFWDGEINELKKEKADFFEFYIESVSPFCQFD
jgi:hypothetical protein